MDSKAPTAQVSQEHEGAAGPERENDVVAGDRGDAGPDPFGLAECIWQKR